MVQKHSSKGLGLAVRASCLDFSHVKETYRGAYRLTQSLHARNPPHPQMRMGRFRVRGLSAGTALDQCGDLPHFLLGEEPRVDPCGLGTFEGTLERGVVAQRQPQ